MSFGKEPTDQHNLIRDRKFCARARDGLRHLLSRLWPGGSARVVLPAYVGHSPLEGSGIVDPLTELGIPYSFYRVDERLDADLSSLEEELGRGEVFAGLIIHYFGRLQPERLKLRDVFRSAGAALIEDCCHCLDLPDLSIGGVGDYTLFSIHKVLPCEDGGILGRNRAAIDPGELPSHARAAALPVRLWRDAAFGEIAARRIDNYDRLASELQGIDGVRPFWPSLPESTVPLNFPVLVDGADRFEVYQRMRASGVGVVALYHTLVDTIDKAKFPISHQISHKILNLPIHQDVVGDEVRLIALALKRALAEGQLTRSFSE